MKFDETPVISYVKLFLLYAQTYDEFKKIAMFLIATKRTLDIASIQDVEKDEVLNKIKNRVNYEIGVPDLDIIREELRKQYLKMFNVSEKHVAANILAKKEGKKANFDRLAQL